MKIRNRLTLLYVAIVAFLLLGLNIYIYYFIDLYVKNDFFNRLNERALIAAQLFLEKDEVTPSAFKEIENKYVKSLPSEVVMIFDKNNNTSFVSDSGKITFPNHILERIRKEKNIEFWNGKRQVVGMFYSDNQGDFVVVVSGFNLHGQQRTNYVIGILIIGFAFCLIMLYFLGRYFSKLVLKPMSDIVRQADQIKASNLHLRIDEGNGKDEIAELAITFNDLLVRLEKSFEMEKEFVHNASHELRTPLATIIGEVEVTLKKARTTDEYKSALASVLYEAQKLNKLTTSLLQLAQTNIDETELTTELIRIDELLWEAKEFVVKENPQRDIKLELYLPDDSSLLEIEANKQLLLAAITNVMENACKYSENKPVKTILKLTTENIQIEIIDQGIGIDQKDVENIFKSFYRGEKMHLYPGFGIGLALAQKIILLHKGSIKIDSNDSASGICVRVEIPLNR